MSSGNFNLEDPAKQEAIRRQPHAYIPTAGKHGAYVPQPYKHQEYPKMMGTAPHPQRKDFEKGKNGVVIPGDMALANYQAAVAEWDRYMQTTVVNSAAEEAAWLKENG